ncbi:Cytochrome c oxidase (B(O/a)3-type) chain I [Candidatus Burkholderia pumila]|uniref:Cytochrome c oxidase (B(O/a)3-type) chain I n=1 Tax=Candidatus Burkholderia pumila TaxID=1090375 RepID=A0ABR5HKR1_9BURK|nr:Cytochrome c oxidase (B(O/a)3-type) chain I [Candidatus Burkholderia pumila]
MVFYDYNDPAVAEQAMFVIVSVSGGFILVISAVLFFIVLIKAHRGPVSAPEAFSFARAVHEPHTIPVALNSFALWIALMIGLTLINYELSDCATRFPRRLNVGARGAHRSAAMSDERLFAFPQSLVHGQRCRARLRSPWCPR